MTSIHAALNIDRKNLKMLFKDAAILLWSFCRQEFDESYSTNGKSIDDQLHDYYYRNGQRLLVEEWSEKYKASDLNTTFSFKELTNQITELISDNPLATPKRSNTRRFAEQSGKRSILKSLTVYINNNAEFKRSN